MSNLLDSEPSTYDEASRHQCWRDAMTKEYESILKNDIWDIVPGPEGISVVTSVFSRSSMQQMGVLRSIRQGLWLMVSLRERE